MDEKPSTRMNFQKKKKKKTLKKDIKKKHMASLD